MLDGVEMLRFSANISTMFNEWALLDRFAAAADAGFQSVEIQFPYEVSPDALYSAREAAGVEVVLLNIPAGRLDQGELGLACLPGRASEFREGVQRAVEYASALGCSQVNCLSGKVSIGEKAEDCWAQLVDNVRYAADHLADHGIRLLVEPLNRVDQPDVLLNELGLAEKLIIILAHPNLALQYDVYHMAANGEDWLNGIAPRLDIIGHIQFSDLPGRGEPGSGTLDLDSFFATMASLPYAGWIGAEYRPSGETLASLGWLDLWSQSGDRSRGIT